ncbi:MAG: polysaccharide biosynthesis C-terminal domain-containing protein [Thermodesulfobacteriota bacterium]|nr:polysaccharide biosynthesis C-terminal domain-containing protein [Thermodesulfobacteriota bacterium]
MVSSQFARDIFTTAFSRFLYVGFGFASGVILARYLGPEGRGIYAAIMVVPNIVVSIADCGLRQAATYYIGRQLRSVRDVISTLLFTLIPVAFLGITISWIAYSVQGFEKYGWGALAIAMSYIPLFIFRSHGVGVGMGLKLISNINASEGIYAALNLTLTWLFLVVLDFALKGALLAITLSLLVQGLILFRMQQGVGKVRIRYIKGLPTLLFSKGIVYALSLFVIRLLYRIDILILNAFVPKTQIGIYAVAAGVAELVWHMPSILGSVIMSYSSAASNEAAFSRRNWRLAKLTMPIAILAGFTLCLVAPIIVPAAYGKAYTEVSAIMWYMMPGIVAVVPFKIMRSDLAGRGLPHVAIYVSTGGLIVNVALNFLLIPKHGIRGAALATTVSYILATVVFTYLYNCICLRPQKADAS